MKVAVFALVSAISMTVLADQPAQKERRPAPKFDPIVMAVMHPQAAEKLNLSEQQLKEIGEIRAKSNRDIRRILTPGQLEMAKAEVAAFQKARAEQMKKPQPKPEAKPAAAKPVAKPAADKPQPKRADKPACNKQCDKAECGCPRDGKGRRGGMRGPRRFGKGRPDGRGRRNGWGRPEGRGPRATRD